MSKEPTIAEPKIIEYSDKIEAIVKKTMDFLHKRSVSPDEALLVASACVAIICKNYEIPIENSSRIIDAFMKDEAWQKRN